MADTDTATDTDAISIARSAKRKSFRLPPPASPRRQTILYYLRGPPGRCPLHTQNAHTHKTHKNIHTHYHKPTKTEKRQAGSECASWIWGVGARSHRGASQIQGGFEPDPKGQRGRDPKSISSLVLWRWRCRVPDAGCRLPGAGCWVPGGAGCWVPGAGCRMPDAGCRMPGGHVGHEAFRPSNTNRANMLIRLKRPSKPNRPVVHIE